MNKGTTSRGNPIAHSCRCEVCGNDMDALAASHARLMKALEDALQGPYQSVPRVTVNEHWHANQAVARETLAEAKALTGEAG